MQRVISNKRGISEIVATVLIVMLTVAAVGIIWVGVLPLVKDNIGAGDVCKNADISIETTQGYTCWDFTANKMFVQIKKGPRDVNVTGLKFYLSSEGNSVNFVRDTDLQKNSYKIFSLNTTGISSLEKLEVVPVSNTKDCSRVFIDKISNCNSEECFLDCSCANNVAVGETCDDGCGGSCEGKLNWWIYQENADEIGLAPEYYYVNYTKPLGATINSLWLVKHGRVAWNNQTPLLYNATIPSSCWNAYPNKLSLRMYSTRDAWFGGSRGCGSRMDCYNGSSWIWISMLGVNIGGYGGSGSVVSNGYQLNDSNWNNYVVGAAGEPMQWYASTLNLNPARLFEEAMWWTSI